MGALFTAHHLGCKAILALTESGSTALWMSRHNIKVPIYGLTSRSSCRSAKMALYRNVRPLLMPPLSDRDTALALRAERLLVERGALRSGDTYAITCGEPMNSSGRHQHASGVPRGLSPADDLRDSPPSTTSALGVICLRGHVLDTRCACLPHARRAARLRGVPPSSRTTSSRPRSRNAVRLTRSPS